LFGPSAQMLNRISIDVFFVWTCHRGLRHSHVATPQERAPARYRNAMTDAKLDLLQGTLDLMVLQTLNTLGPLHGYGIARRIEQMSGDEVILNQGTIYASLVRLQQRGWISAEWGTSDNNRRAKFYELTRQGRKHLAEQTSTWERLSAVMGRILGAQPEGSN
jgi:PadR family transcriptional regulator PadR